MAELNGSSNLLHKAHSLCATGRSLDALKLCLPYAEAGDVGCARLVGWIYCTGGPSIDKDLHEAGRWLALASDSGDPLATYLLGTVLYDSGQSEAAIEKFRDAGERGVSAGFFQIGKLYDVGSGVELNKGKAFDYYCQSSNMGHIFARRRVASMLIEGRKGLLGRIVGVPMLIFAIALGACVAITDPHGERTYS